MYIRIMDICVGEDEGRIRGWIYIETFPGLFARAARGVPGDRPCPENPLFAYSAAESIGVRMVRARG